MPIIQGSRKFEGSNIDQASLFNYIRTDVKQLVFDKDNNREGLYVLFLPAYKADSNGEGVWFKSFSVRKAFGLDKAKKNYYVHNLNDDPASYFERAFRARYPEQAKPVKPGEGNNSTKFTIYPNYGHVTQRVAFNVAPLKLLQAAAPLKEVIHVLDLPAYKGADQLTKWMDQPQPDGSQSPLLNDVNAAIGTFLKLNSDVGKDGGWQISPNIAYKYVIPEQYALSENLYNLDEIFVIKMKEEIIGDLRQMFPANVFDICMEGYAGFKTVAAFPTNPLPTPPAPTVSVPLPLPASTPTNTGAYTIPAPPAASPTVAPAIAFNPPVPPAPVASVISVTPAATNEVIVGGKVVNKDDLRAFLEAKK